MLVRKTGKTRIITMNFYKLWGDPLPFTVCGLLKNALWILPISLTPLRTGQIDTKMITVSLSLIY
jgi:hypothetical protein